MPYYYKKQKRWDGRKATQYGLAILVLLIGIVILFSWLFIRYQMGSAPDTNEQAPPTTVQQETPTEIGRCLLIFDFDGVERFVLVQTDPAHHRITAVPVASTIADHDGCTLAQALHRHGALSVTNTISKTLDLPTQHYISFTPKGVEDLVNHLDEGILFQVPEKVTYTDENGANIVLSAGEHRLSAGQVRTLLAYTGWNKAVNRSYLAADLVTATLNQYLSENRSLEAQFSIIFNASTTDLRNDNFISYRSALALLAQNNHGTVCQRVNLPGTKANGFFSPDLERFRKESGLY
ncbi:MAG: hypothetical protein E7527_01085 [Ruminococcaceae bacterium]|nr:hypothetical protein [Oscillospiraceae bacterium]